MASSTILKPLTKGLDENEVLKITEEVVHGEVNEWVIGKPKPKEGVICAEQKEATVLENIVK